MNITCMIWKLVSLRFSMKTQFVEALSLLTHRFNLGSLVFLIDTSVLKQPTEKFPVSDYYQPMMSSSENLRASTKTLEYFRKLQRPCDLIPTRIRPLLSNHFWSNPTDGLWWRSMTHALLAWDYSLFDQSTCVFLIQLRFLLIHCINVREPAWNSNGNYRAANWAFKACVIIEVTFSFAALQSSQWTSACHFLPSCSLSHSQVDY